MLEVTISWESPDGRNSIDMKYTREGKVAEVLKEAEDKIKVKQETEDHWLFSSEPTIKLVPIK